MGKPKEKKPPTEKELAALQQKHEKALIKACQNDEVGKAKKAVESGAALDMDVSGDVGALTTPMHFAASFGSYEVCKYLFEAGGAELLEARNKKKMTPIELAEAVGEDKVVRLLHALLKGESPPVEESDDDDDDEDEMPMPDSPKTDERTSLPIEEDAYPVERPAAVEAENPTTVVAPEASIKPEAPQSVEAISSIRLAHFKLSLGKLGMAMEKNVVAKAWGAPEEGDDAFTQAASQGVQPGWVLRKVGGETAVANTKAVMKQLAKALKAAGEAGAECAFELPEGDARHCAVCDKFVLEAQFAASQLLEGPGKQCCAPCDYTPSHK